jgi:hypothetical protein
MCSFPVGLCGLTSWTELSWSYLPVLLRLRLLCIRHLDPKQQLQGKVSVAVLRMCSRWRQGGVAMRAAAVCRGLEGWEDK